MSKENVESVRRTWTLSTERPNYWLAFRDH
jgi:hypothetical protein